MTRDQIKDVLPHREPMLLVDSAWLGQDGLAYATYRIPEQPYFCEGHFPGKPIVPGVILCEIMAQGTVAHFVEVFKEHILLYRGLDQVKFRGEVHPGDLCEVSASLLESKGNIYVCDASLSVAGKRCAQARITLAAIPR